MTHIPPTAEFRTILAQLELLSHGSTQSWNRSSPPSEMDRSPRGDSFPPHEEFRIEWEIADSDEARARVIRNARAHLEQQTRRTTPKVEPLPDDTDDRIIDEGAGWSAGDVARALRISIKRVVAVRLERKLDPSTGRKPLPDEDPVTQARRLADLGVGVTAIARYQGRPKQTVSDCLKRAA